MFWEESNLPAISITAITCSLVTVSNSARNSSTENPKINTKNLGVKRATEIVSYENISPEEWEEAKIEASKRKVITLEREEEREETQIAIAESLLQTTLSNQEMQHKLSN